VVNHRGNVCSTVYFSIDMKIQNIHLKPCDNINCLLFLSYVTGSKWRLLGWRYGKVQISGEKLTDQNCMHEEINNRLHSGNACYHSVQSLLSSRLLSKNVKVKIFKTIILSIVLRGCEARSLTLTEEHRLRMFENRVLRSVFGRKWDEVTEE
jgi:hypothetical protein